MGTTSTGATGVLGADTAQLKQLATAFDDQAAKLESLKGSLKSKASAAYWRGPDRDKFQHDWDGTHLPSLTKISQEFRRLAALTRQELAQQEATSSEHSLSHFIGTDYLVYSEGGDGREARVFGDLETATHIAIYVPGMDTEHDGADPGGKHLYEELQKRAAPGERVAVVTGLVYNAPDLTNVFTTAPAYDGRAGLQRLANDINAINGTAAISLVAHSYGGMVTGAAMKSKEGLDIDQVIAIGSPGMTVDEIDDLHSPNTKVWAGAPITDPVPFLPSVAGGILHNWDDPFGNIPLVGGALSDIAKTVERETLGTSFLDHSSNFGFGVAPTDPSFGATIFDTGDAFGHSEYLTDPGSVSNIARIVLGDKPKK